MPDMPSIVILKTFGYRGVPEEWGNVYHFSGTTPGTSAEWKTLADAIWAEERKFLPADVKINRALGYAAGNEISVFQVNYFDPPNTITGGLLSTGTQPPGDAAVWIRWATGERNIKGRPIYLRKYFHGVNITPPDTVLPTARTAMLAYGAKMTDGTLPGGFRVCGPQGAVAGTVKVPTSVTTRTLKRRGKDPS